MRELRVEDALMYLDQVKVEFGDRPQIYNEFLHIMKTFKSQEIDTPGVILRVTQLFQGNKSLVLGFNTFLPDGFKIVIPDQSSGTVYYRTPGQPLLTPILNMAGGPQQPRIPDHGMAHQNMKPGQNSQGGGPNFGNMNMQQQHQGQSRGQMGGMPNGGGGVKPPSQGQVQQMQSGNQQQLQQKQQQQQSPLTSGQQMNMPMMQGHPPKPPMHMQHQEQQKPQHPIQQQQSQHQMHIGGPRGGGEMHQMHQQQSQQQPQQQPSQQMMQQQPPSQQMQVQQPERPQPQQQQQQQQAPSQQQAEDEGGVPVEFDHAINYVTTIKRTFANDPDTYKKFLEILHTYQKEQRGIKEVLDEVSVLFADHPVLLKDFTYFLPDAVQQQAKMQLAHAVRQAESRRAALNSRAAIENQARQQREVHPPAPEPEKVHQIDAWRTGGQQRKPFGVKEGRSEEREREICRSAVYGVVSFDPVRPPRKHELTPGQAAAKYGRPRTIPEVIVQPTTKEAAFFERAKEHLNRRELLSDKSVTKRHTPHSEFLKCLHLYGCGILDKDELMLLLGTLFMQGHAPKTGANAGGGSNNPHIASAATKLLKEFEKLLVGRGPYARQQSALKDKSKYGCITTKEWDPTLSDDITTSYKTYPSDYPYEDFYTHSGQSKEDASVLNTEVVCVRNEKNVSVSKIRLLDSLEEYDGVRARRNIYEEALAKAEDERFEVDYALETNASAMRHVQPFAEEVTMLKTNEEKEDQPIGRMHYQLRPDSLLSTHLGAIARLYGEQGDEVLHHLMRNPISVLPIVFKRLQEKDNEWRTARVELTKHWRKVCEINHEASLDATSYFNRREIERSVTHDVLVEECKRAFHNAKTAKENPQALESIAPTSTISHEDSSMLLYHSHISVKAKKNMPHKELYDCLSLQVLNGAAKTSADRERVSRIWTEFVLPWFDLPTHWFLNELKDKARSDKSSCIVKYAIGQQVKTPFGNGKILSYEEGSSMSGSHYVVELAFGKAHVRPSSIVHHNIADVQYSRYNGCMELVQDPDYEMDEKKELPSTCQLLYGTEKIYMFMRLYCALLSLFNNAKKNMTPDANAMETEGDGESKENKFKAFLSIIKDYVNEDIEFKTYELRCRDLTDKDLFELSAIPRLLEKCGDCLVKVAKEDNLLSLYDFYRLKTMDPVLQRKQSFTVTEDASFRIQFNPVEGKIHFCYLPFEKDMLTSPRVSSTTSAQVVEKQSMGTEEVVAAEEQPSKTETKVEAEEGEIGEVTEEPQSKRVKLE